MTEPDDPRSRPIGGVLPGIGDALVPAALTRALADAVADLPLVLAFESAGIALYALDFAATPGDDGHRLAARPLGAAPFDADGQPTGIAALARTAAAYARDARDARDGDAPPRIRLWLPEDQVAVIESRLPMGGRTRPLGAMAAAMAKTGQSGPALALLISPPKALAGGPAGEPAGGPADAAAAGNAPCLVLASFQQTVREAMAYAEGWGFAPVAVSGSLLGRVEPGFEAAADVAMLSRLMTSAEINRATRSRHPVAPPATAGAGSGSGPPPRVPIAAIKGRGRSAADGVPRQTAGPMPAAAAPAARTAGAGPPARRRRGALATGLALIAAGAAVAAMVF
ncbi:MAG: hypothetical protein AAF677_17165, partial [Pseudomonadota bacterium]